MTSNDELKRLSEKIDNLTEEEISNLKEIYKKEERKSNIKSTEFSFILQPIHNKIHNKAVTNIYYINS